MSKMNMPESELFNEISALRTERQNPSTARIDAATTLEILGLINQEDSLVPRAVAAEIPFITEAVELIVKGFSEGGRLIYVGAGTSGRLGIIDAAECPPTFGTEPQMVQAIIAGGNKAVFQAQEGAEDSSESGAKVIREINASATDVICGIAASGRTPFVRGALAEARRSGCKTILVTTSAREDVLRMGIQADVLISPDVGPEVIAGSTRMKSGTAQKLVLNMLTTASMIRLGKTYGNIMIDLQLTNDKLRERAKKIIMMLSGCDYDTAEKTLIDCHGNVKTALVVLLANLEPGEAKTALEKGGGFVRAAIDNYVHKDDI